MLWSAERKRNRDQQKAGDGGLDQQLEGGSHVHMRTRWDRMTSWTWSWVERIEAGNVLAQRFFIRPSVIKFYCISDKEMLILLLAWKRELSRG